MLRLPPHTHNTKLLFLLATLVSLYGVPHTAAAQQAEPPSCYEKTKTIVCKKPSKILLSCFTLFGIASQIGLYNSSNLKDLKSLALYNSLNPTASPSLAPTASPTSNTEYIKFLMEQDSSYDLPMCLTK